MGRSYDTRACFPMTIEQHQQHAEQLLRDAGILPVVTVDSVEHARRLADALMEGGLRSPELTLRTPLAPEAQAAPHPAPPAVVVAAGSGPPTHRTRHSHARTYSHPGTPN